METKKQQQMEAIKSDYPQKWKGTKKNEGWKRIKNVRKSIC